MTDISLRRGEFVRHVVDTPGDHSLMAEVGAGARLDCVVMADASSRHDIHVRLLGEGAECHLHAAAVLSGDDICEITPVFEHIAENTTSTQTVRLAADGSAKASCICRTVIMPGAAKSDGQQSARGILLSPQAEIALRPEMEIYTDDISCRHGATVGELDADALFYMRSRGIPPETARQMLMRAFLAEAFACLPEETLRMSMQERIDNAL